MSQPTQVTEDIAYLRTAAEAGGRPSPTAESGAILLAAGVIFGAASVGHWAVVTERIELSLNVLWSAAMTVFFSVMAAMILRMTRNPAARLPGNRAVGMAWSGAGGAIFVIAFSAGLIGRNAASVLPMQIIPSAVLALYGVAWGVNAILTNRSWMWAISVGCYACAIGVAAFSGRQEVWLAYGLALLVLAALPGFVMMRLAAKDE